MENLSKVAFGGGCHWCTEAVFLVLDGVREVEQGYVSSFGKEDYFSEAVIVHYYDEIISLRRLMKIHLHTHSSTSSHSMRKKYRSAVYTFSAAQQKQAQTILKTLAGDFEEQLITKALKFNEFRSSKKEFHKYYENGPERPFCRTYITPKLKYVAQRFSPNIKA